MPGVMHNGYDYDDRSGRRPNSGQNSNYDLYRRNDDRRDDYLSDIYTKPHRNGNSAQNERFNWTDPVTDRSSLDGRTDVYKGHEPVFEVDHLATFTATRRDAQGLISLDEGLSKLRNMEVMTGIWTMRCLMVIERNYIIILDNQNGEEHDRFPIDVVYKPTAIVRNDPREIYNNLILFTVVTDPRKGAPEPNMHIFQSVSASAEDIADEIHSAKEGKPRLSQGHRIPPAPAKPAPEPPLSSASAVYQERHRQGLNSFTFEQQQRGAVTRQRQGSNVDTYERRETNNQIYSGQRGSNIELMESPQRGTNMTHVHQGSNTTQVYDDRGVTSSQATDYFGTRQRIDQQSLNIASEEPRPLSGMYNMRSRPQVNRDREDTESMPGERIEQDMQKLNACCDDIEKFVARLQQAAEAYKELENRKKERGKAKSKQMGDGMLSMRAKPPRNDDFIDIFQKFKYAFNILARLKPYIHDPNAPELVHFLFTPLSLIYEASRDTSNPTPLASRAVSPLLTREAKDLLLNCLTSKEQEFWMSLGDAWFLTREQWRGQVPTYMPRFYSSWQPAPSDIDDDPRGAMNQAVVAQMAQIRHRNEMDYARNQAANQVLSYPPVEERFPHGYRDRRDDGLDNYNTRLPTPPPGAFGGDPRVAGYQEYVERHIDRNKRLHDEPVMAPSPAEERRPVPMSRDEANMMFARDLRYKGAKVSEVVHSRQGKNPKELTVEKGDIVEVLEDTKNWWKLRNYLGEMGHAPYTILKDFKEGGDNGYDDRPVERDYEGNGLQHNRNNSGVYSPQLPSFTDGYGQQSQASNSNYQNSRQGRREDPPVRHPSPPPPAPVPAAPPPPVYDAPRHSPKPVRKPTGQRNEQKDDLQDELRARMNNVLLQNKSRALNRDVRITQHSSPDEVAEWLIGKQFSSDAVMMYRDYTGAEMFRLKRHELERHLGREEGARLESQLTVQRNISGYGTKSAAELKAILSRRKERSDSADGEGSTTERLGRPPNFVPDTPRDISPSNSEADSEELMTSMPANTLRDMLLRQRQKIFTDQYDNPS